jgi:hypothetical protein
MHGTPLLSWTVALALVVAAESSAEEVTRWQFDFGPGAAPNGFTQVDADHIYTDEAGFGFVDPIGVKGRTITGVARAAASRSAPISAPATGPSLLL